MQEVKPEDPARHPYCPYCAASSSLLVRSTDYNRGTTQAEFFYFQCSGCGLIFMDPIPDNMQPYYEGGYETIPASLAELRAIGAREKYRLDPILRYKRAGKLLEIGPWRGVFCINAKDAGFDVSAIEMDQQCVRFLREVVGIDAIRSFNPAETLRSLDRQFDVIALWHSLEHLPSPWQVVQAAAQRLAPGGLLLISIPNIGSYEFSVLRERWRHLDTPRHLFFYPVDSLNALCESNGFEKLELSTGDGVSVVLARDTWHHWSMRWSRIPFVSRNLFRLALTFAKLRERGRADAGSGMTAVFRLRDRAAEQH